MQPFAKNYINKSYENESCHRCGDLISSDNTTMKSIILGKQLYGNVICKSCSKLPTKKLVIKGDSEDGDDDMEMSMEDKSIGTSAFPSIAQKYRSSTRIKNGTITPVRPFKKQRFLV